MGSTIFRKVKKLFIDKEARQMWLAAKGVYNRMPDEDYLKMRFKNKFGRALDLENPRSFNEKIQWLKLYDCKPIYTTMVDKYEVKQYVAERIGEEYIIPTLGVWDRFEDIDFDSLPNQFVLKCTHDSGGVVIVKDKSQLDMEKARAKLGKRLKRNFYYTGREWPYKNVKPRIIAEVYMEDSVTAELRDYKFFAFNGIVKTMFISSNRQSADEEKTLDFFDKDYNHLPIRKGCPNANVLPERPQNFEKMWQLAETLAAGIPHLRVDFYEVDGKIYFGELTFSSGSGLIPFEPEQWDYTFGDWITLPGKE